MNVEQQMTKTLWSCRPEDTLAQAARLLWEHDCGSLPVTDEHGQLQGMLTDRDICMAAYTTGARLSEVPVSQAMATRLATVRPDTLLRVAEHMMREQGIHRLPVVDDRYRLVGMLTTNDLLRQVDDTGTRGNAPGNAPSDAVRLVRTLAAIGAARNRVVVSEVPSTRRAPQAVMSPAVPTARGTMLAAMSRAVQARSNEPAWQPRPPMVTTTVLAPIAPDAGAGRAEIL
jgi:CBS domain-containing protein